MTLVLASLFSCRPLTSSGSKASVDHALFISLDENQSRAHFEVITETGKVVWQGDAKSRGDTTAIMPMKHFNDDEIAGVSYVIIGNQTSSVKGIDRFGNVYDSPEGIPFADAAEGVAQAVSATDFGKKKLCGYVDEKFKMKIPFSFDNCGAFSSNGLAAVRRKNEWGYIDQSGQTRVPFQYSLACPFAEGAAQVQSNGENYVIDKAGNVLFDLLPGSTSCAQFSDGRLATSKGQLGGYVDHSGKWVIPARYSTESGFVEGRAFVRENSPSSVSMIDTDGHLVPIAEPIQGANDFVKGLATVLTKKSLYSFGLISAAGQFVVQPTFGEIKDLRNGYRAATVFEPVTKTTFLDPQGKEMKPPRPRCNDYLSGVFVCLANPDQLIDGGLDYVKADGTRIGGWGSGEKR